MVLPLIHQEQNRQKKKKKKNLESYFTALGQKCGEDLNSGEEMCHPPQMQKFDCCIHLASYPDVSLPGRSSGKPVKFRW